MDGDSATVPVSVKGTTTITASAVDAAGNAGPTLTTTVRIDGTVPTVSSVVTPAPVNGWNRGPVTVQVSASDAETGIREIRTSVGAADPVVTPGSSVSVPVAAEGATTVAYTAVDRAGNEASGSTVVRIDSVLPTATHHLTAGHRHDRGHGNGRLHVRRPGFGRGILHRPGHGPGRQPGRHERSDRCPPAPTGRTR